MCCESDWKREVVQDYKWDYIDVRDFRKTNFWTRFKYCLVYVFIIRDLTILGLDIFTCVTMLSSDHWSNAAIKKCNENCNFVKFQIARWVFVGCIFFSILLYAYEFYQAREVILSRDISYSFTNIMANDYYSIKDYNNFCVFCELGASKKKKDTVSFFVFFTFKNWKRILLADGPRQSINAIILYMILHMNHWNWNEITSFWRDDTGETNSIITLLLLLAMVTTVALFAIAAIQIIVAAVLYIPLLVYIQGNLKEYVCHKVDKRMGNIMRRIQKQRIARNAEMDKKIARGGMIQNAKGELVDASVLQPTLPTINLDDDKMLTQPLVTASRPMTPSGRPMTPAGRPMTPTRGMTPGRPGAMSPTGRPMSPAVGRPMSPAAPPSAWPQPTIKPEVTEFDIYDAYGDDKSNDDHSYHGHGNLGYGLRDADASQVSLLGAAAPLGMSYPPSPISRPSPTVEGAPSYPPSASVHSPLSANPSPQSSRPSPTGQPFRNGPQVVQYETRAEWSVQYDTERSPVTPLSARRYDHLQGHGW